VVLTSMYVIPYPIRRNLLSYLALASALGVGLMLGMMIPALHDQSLYRLIMLLAGACIGMGAVISGDSQRILLIFLVLTIPLNLPFSSTRYSHLSIRPAAAGVGSSLVARYFA
jgi:hypothetical protein